MCRLCLSRSLSLSLPPFLFSVSSIGTSPFIRARPSSCRPPRHEQSEPLSAEPGGGKLLAEFFRCFLPSSYVDKVSHSVPGPPEASHYGAVCRSPTGRAETKARTTVKLFEVLCDNTKTDMLVTPHTSVASCWQRRCIPVLAQPCACAYDTITHGEQCLGLLGLQLLKTHGLEKGGAA